jgi:hypothetical protein
LLDGSYRTSSGHNSLKNTPNLVCNILLESY